MVISRFLHQVSPIYFQIKNKKFPIYNVLALIVITKFSSEWHKIMAHASNEMIKYFPSLVTNVKIINKKFLKIS